MKTALRLIVFLAASASVALLRAADEPAKETPAKPDATKPASSEVGRIRDDAPGTSEQTATPDAKKPAAAVAPAAKKSDEVITLPAVQVTRSRVRKIDVTIKRLDKLIARERKHLKSTETDRTLNNDAIAQKAAFFGGYSTAQRTAVASERVRLLESERELLEQMKAPMTREDFLVVEKQVEMLRTARRELDIVYR